MKTSQASGKPVIGIVGGVGAGKSLAAGQFAALGCWLVDADKIGHALLDEPNVQDAIRRRWGGEAFTLDGQVSRKALAEVVFKSQADLAALNAILHPLIRRRIVQAIAEAQADASVTGVVLDAAVMFEAGWDDVCSHRIFVSAPAADRQRRVVESRRWSVETWRGREKSQISLDIKAARCEYTLNNRFGASFLREQVRVLFHRIRQED